MNGYPDPGSLERTLFSLRMGIYSFERPGDAASFLAPIRPLLKSDERVRTLFINRVPGGVDTLCQEFYMDQRALLNVLQEELQDSARRDTNSTNSLRLPVCASGGCAGRSIRVSSKPSTGPRTMRCRRFAKLPPSSSHNMDRNTNAFNGRSGS